VKRKQALKELPIRMGHFRVVKEQIVRARFYILTMVTVKIFDF
jgi:hypothetical protein